MMQREPPSSTSSRQCTNPARDPDGTEVVVATAPAAATAAAAAAVEGEEEDGLDG